MEKLIKVGSLGGIPQDVMASSTDKIRDVCAAAGLNDVQRVKAAKTLHGTPKQVSLDAKANGYKIIYVVPAVNGGR